jgi:hypothetical protein
MPKVRTLYNPGVAMVYCIKNTKTDEVVSASTCGIKDVECAPWRSPKGTPIGKEFFKMKIGTKKKGIKVVTFLNSSQYFRCLSDDGEWEFIGQRSDGGIIPKLTDENAKKAISGNNIPTKESIVTNSKRVKATIEKINDTRLSMSTSDIQTTLQNEEFVDLDEMSKILK